MLCGTLMYFLLCRFQCVQTPNKVLESISIIDTPGILTAAKRKLSRGKTEYILISISVSNSEELMVLASS